MTYLHGLSPDTAREARAAHAAGHLVMDWLLDRPATTCILQDTDGSSPASLPPKTAILYQRLLGALAGIAAEGNREVIADLFDNFDNPDYFSRQSDAYTLARTATMIDERERRDILVGCLIVASELFQSFDSALQQTKTLLLRDSAVHSETAQTFRRDWDRVFQLEERPKSDVIYRALAKQFAWDLPADCFIGWDFHPVRPKSRKTFLGH